MDKLFEKPREESFIDRLDGIMGEFAEHTTSAVRSLADVIEKSSSERVSDTEFAAVMAASAGMSMGLITFAGGGSPIEAKYAADLARNAAVITVEGAAIGNRVLNGPLERSTTVLPLLAKGMRKWADSIDGIAEN